MGAKDATSFTVEINNWKVVGKPALSSDLFTPDQLVWFESDDVSIRVKQLGLEPLMDLINAFQEDTCNVLTHT